MGLSGRGRFAGAVTRRLAQLVLTCAFGALLAALPGPASATSIAGPNGKIVFASGRASKGIPTPSASDADARIWVADGPTATPVQVTTLPAGTQHRHPNWSPDHSKIAYAAGAAFSPTSHYAIWIADLRTGDQTEFVAAADGQDRPTWSPDGTKIAYGSGGNIFVKDIAPGSQPVQITIGTSDQRPVWSPDGNTLYFNRGAAGNRDIYRVTPVAPNGTVTGVLTDATDDWQPAVSPDGSRLCFLRGPQTDMADLYTVNANGTGASPFSTTANVGDLNCVWSPNGSSVLFTLGAFTGGDLELRDKNGNNPDLLSDLNVAAHFDGNADWATNFSPKCANKIIPQVAVNGFTSITLGCTDPDASLGAEPPTPTPLGGDELSIASPPSHGNIGALSDDGKLIYTPNKNFRGTDTFTFTGNDGASDSAPATVTVNVGIATGGGRDVTDPLVAGLKLSSKRWRLGPLLPRLARVGVGTTISFKLSEPGTVKLSFQRATRGRRSGRRCVKTTPRNGTKRSCTRFVSVGSITGLRAKAGLNRVRFQGRLSRSRRLTLGSYRVVVSAVDAAGNNSRRYNSSTFTIVAG